MANREPLTREDVTEVAELALLNVSEEDLDRYTEQLDAVLDLAGQLDQFDVDGVPPTAHPFGLVNVFRGDSIDTEMAEVRQEALAAGPEVEDHQFKVPPALGESP